MKIGDYVEVYIGMGLCANAKIITEYTRKQIDATPTNWNHCTRSKTNTFQVRFLDKSTHICPESDMRLLSEKEQFVLKLKGEEDREMTKVYEALDGRA